MASRALAPVLVLVLLLGAAGCGAEKRSRAAGDPGIRAPRSAPAGPIQRPTTAGAARAQCLGAGFHAQPDDHAAAVALMAGRLHLSSQPVTALPADLTWHENPLHDPNWVHNLHTLRWADVLRREGIRTGNRAMLARHRGILQDWLRDNPRVGAPSRAAWNDMVTGLRTIAFACALGSYGPERWLLDALAVHGTVLADPRFGLQAGNHALHVRLGLLVAGCVLADRGWTSAARAGITALLRTSVDTEGVTDEGSIAYQLNNFRWYREARSRLTACGSPPGPVFDRVPRMAEFLTQATQPDGTYVQIGDGDRRPASAIRGNPGTLYAATRGREGVRPDAVYRAYRRGYVFGRSGWGGADPLFYSLRFGPPLATQPHAHQDAGALTLAAHGRTVLFDAGRYRYDSSRMSRFLESRAAHNTVDVPGAEYRTDVPAILLAAVHTATHDATTVRMTALRGTTWTRTVLYSRTGGYLVVTDQVVNDRPATMVQRWNLAEDRPTRLGATSVTTPDVTLFWTGSRPRLAVTTGQRDPLLGWRSYAYGEVFPAPMVEARLAGRTGRYVTVIVPGRGGAVPTSAGGWLTVTANGVSERVRPGSADAPIRMARGGPGATGP